MSDLFASRREKLDRLRSLGIDPWGGRFDGQQPIGEIRRREAEITVTPPPADQPDKHPSSTARGCGLPAGSC